MISVGIDIVENTRIRKMVKQYKKKFIERILTPKEIQQYVGLGGKLEFLAGRFCLKEAFFKATKKRLISFHDVCILNDKNGEPQLKIQNKKLTIKNVSVSISHSKNYTIAICIISN